MLAGALPALQVLAQGAYNEVGLPLCGTQTVKSRFLLQLSSSLERQFEEQLHGLSAPSPLCELLSWIMGTLPVPCSPSRGGWVEHGEQRAWGPR